VASTSTNATETKTMNIDYSKEGYSIGTITYQKDSKCAYIITDEKSGIKFDPINIDKDLFESYKVDNSKIYFKYRPLRMMNRCTEAQPIELEDIKKREAK
jgi:hypothetical protein